MNEGRKEFNYCKSLEKKGFTLIKIYKKGYPDRLVITPQGEFYFIEFKVKGGVLSEVQKIIINKLVNKKVKVQIIEL